MATPVLSIEQQALAALRAGAVVVTSNQRAARHLLRACDRAQQQAGRQAWASSPVLHWGGWMKSLWQERLLAAADTPPILLRGGREEALWRQVIAAQDAPAAGLHLSAAAATAMGSWRVLHQYGIPLDHASFRRRADSAAFRAWAEAYRKRCGQNDWLDEARLPAALEDALGAGTLAAPARVFLCGFDELTPQQKSFLQAAEARGTVVEHATVGAPGPALAVQARDTDEELAAVARWARRRLEEAGDGTPPRLAIVVPNLAGLRGRVERAFLEALHPEMLCDPAAAGPRAFELSAGPPLASYPMVAAALVLARVLAPGHLLRLADAARLLLAPFFAGEKEAMARARLEVRLRRGGEMHSLRGLAGEAFHGAPELSRRLLRAARYARRLPESAPPSQWVKHLVRLLRHLGWPGARARNSAEQQTLSKWDELLADVAGLDLVLPLVSAAEAPSLFRAAAEAQSFQPEREDAPVQVVGMLEAAASEFDALWVTGLHDEAWPTAAAPDALLPLVLQRERGVPGASAETQLQAARRILARLRASAGEVVFSYPVAEGDGELRPTPLLKEEGIVPARIEEPAPAGASPWAERLWDARAAEELTDEAAPPLEAGVLAGGGTGVFKSQAACPFRAFAEYRLGAQKLEQHRPGIDSLARGNLLHHALAGIWQELKDRDGLLACQGEARQALIARCVEEGLHKARAEGSCAWEQRVAELERERAIRLLGVLLAEEERRPPFTVHAREEKRAIALGGLEVNVKADRVDRLANGGGLVILDYKSGNNTPSIRSWEIPRPEEPQLPLYAATVGQEEVGAVAFVHLAPGNVKFHGMAREEGLVPDARPPRDGAAFSALVESWRRALTALGEDFRRGHAAVDPKQHSTCRHCHLPALCRIGEVRPVRREEGEAEEEGGDD